MDETKPEVSVVIPCYNGERFITEAIESVLAQTAGDPEVVVVDDGSYDGSLSVIERYTETDRVRLFRHESNRGVAAARNTGIRNAEGRLIGFLDQDDLWRAEKLAAQLEVFGRDHAGDVGVVIGDVEVLDIDTHRRYPLPGKPPRNLGLLDADGLLARMFLSDFMTIGTALIRAECFEKVGLLDETILSGSDDFELFVRLAQQYRFEYVPRTLAIRRVHGRNYTDTERMVPDALAILDRTAARRPSLAPTVPRARSHYLYRLARDLHAKGKSKRARRAYRDSIAANPRNVRSVAGLVLCGLGPVGDAILAAVRRVRSRPTGQ